MTRSTMREHIFKLLFRAPFIDNKDEYEEQIDLYFADADMVDASHLKEEEYNYIKNKYFLNAFNNSFILSCTVILRNKGHIAYAQT